MKNYYEILEVNKNASPEVIEKAYKVLVKKYHPDLNSAGKKEHDENKIKEINEAYNVLTDNFLREQYDNELEKYEQQKLADKYSINEHINNDKINIKNEQSNEKYEYHMKSRINDNQNRNVYEKKAKIGSLAAIIEICKELYQNKPKRDEMKEMTKKDALAVGLTILFILIIGIVLWLLPFTNGWMRQLLFENPIFNLIGKIFGK